ncbi:DMT family transporter [Sphingomonas sp. LaA6.9]|uniref:DMT family transporter n=1 Tax=Sphingomonas sp. LaA6.9 TaxID=2919914 RepID=UPI001F501385|nr:DMT family transporter [Sphingomonas sp. LaA6.9]MCJ8157652.1 DMT family transporter [Sphingomonas sp. LaA6.9]
MSAMIQQRMGPREWLVFGVLSVVWGGSFFFIEISLRSFPPLTLVLLRASISAAALIMFLGLSGRNLPASPRIWLAFLLLGALNIALPFVLVAWGQTHIPIGLASILNATTPLWGVVVAHAFTADEKATPGKIVGVLSGIAGVAMMIGGDALAELGDNLLAQIACVAAALSYALAGVYGRRFKAMGVAPVEVAAGQLIAAAAIMLPLAMIFDTPWRLPAPLFQSVAAMACLALVSTAFAYILYFRLIETAGATNALLVTFVIPIPAILLGTFLLGEALEPKHYAGMALIGIGLAAIDGRPFGWLRRARASTAAPQG